MMASLRFCSLAAALAVALGTAAPASAEWWKMGALSPGASGQPAPASPAAQKPPAASTAVPEPADFILFAAGVAGLLLGRRGSRSRRGDGE